MSWPGRARAEARKEGYALIRLLCCILIVVALVAPATAVAHPARSRTGHGLKHRCLPCDRAWGRRHHWHPRPRFTGYAVEGRVSTFGWLTGDSEGQTADGGTTRRPCIAIYSRQGLGHWFQVTIGGHRARLLQCDIGPAPWTGRAIDVTGVGDQALGFSPSSFPTDSWGVARELR